MTMDGSIVKITLPGCPIPVEVFSLDGIEQLSQPYQYHLDLVSKEELCDPEALIGQPVLISMQDHSLNVDRYIQGCISEVSVTGYFGHYFRFSVSIVPPVWLLSMRQQFRIFKHKTAVDVIREVFDSANIEPSSVEFSLQSTYPVLEYCVQYRETDLNFVHRLMEEAGIYYYFRHQEDGLKMILVDDVSHHGYSEIEKEISYVQDNGLVAQGYTIGHLGSYNCLARSRFQLSDYNYTKPALDLTQSARIKGLSGAEWADYPGLYADTDSGKKRVSILGEIENVRKNSVHARGEFQFIMPGVLFDLDDHPQESLNRSYLVTYLKLSVTQPEVIHEQAAGNVERYMEMKCIPSDIQFRAPMITVRPSVRGVHTAVVVGPEGEDVFTDEYGRVKIAFPWDQKESADDQRSCWVRVNQNWAGAGWGSMFLPRIGSEVIVDFIDGNPDQPVVTGQVYHAVNKPPYELPEHKTRSTIRTRSLGEDDGFNEIRFEDKSGHEELYFHAQRNHAQHVGVRRIAFVGEEDHCKINSHQKKQVGGSSHLSVAENMTMAIGESLSLSVSGDKQVSVTGNHALEAGSEIHLAAGNKVVIDAGSELTIRAAGSFIKLHAGGIDISGPVVNINSGGTAGRGRGVTVEQPEPVDEAGEEETDVKADRPSRPQSYSPKALALKQAAIDGAPFCEQCQTDGGDV